MMKRFFSLLLLLVSFSSIAQQKIVAKSLRFSETPSFQVNLDDSSVLMVNRATGITYRTTVASLGGGSGWGLTGSGGTNTNSNFIGTTDANGIAFRTNNNIAGLVPNSEPAAPFFFRGTGNSMVTLGSHAGENQYLNNYNLSGTYIGTYAGRYQRSGANTFIGFHTGLQHVYGGEFGGRNVAIGDWSMNVGHRTYNNTAVGVFTLNNFFYGNSNDAFGKDALKSLNQGSGMVGLGNSSLLYASTGIESVTVVNGGSGYTTATVNFPVPQFIPNGGNCSTQATGYATISGGVITGIVITNPGCGYLAVRDSVNETAIGYTYNWIPDTVTITGDGTGAVLQTNFRSPEGVMGVGGYAGIYDRMGYYNTYLGVNAGNTGVHRYYDSYVNFIGSGSGVNTGVSSFTPITNAIAIGKNARVSQSNSFILGGTGSDQVNVGIGTETPTSKLSVSTPTSLETLVNFHNSSASSTSQVRINFTRAGDIGTGYAKGMVLFASSASGAAGSNSGWADYEQRRLSFYTGATPGTATERMAVMPSGNVQIGTPVPSTDWGHRLLVEGGNLTATDNVFLATSSGNVGIGTLSASEKLHIAGSLRIVNGTQAASRLLTSDANGVATWQDPPSPSIEGTYTPTLTNTTNITASTAYTTYYIQVGEWIHVWGEVDIHATASLTICEMQMSLPIGSELSSTYELAGTASFEDNTSVQIKADVSGNQARFRFTPQTATNNKYSFHFSYKYIAP